MISNVYILQSLRSKDPIRCGKVLAGRLQAILPVDFVDVPDATKLFEELKRIKTAIVNLPAPAVIHFHCHGNESGIGLHDQDDHHTLVTWENFRAIFRDIYRTAPVKPLISFCSCKGLNIMQLIAQYEPCPHETIAGCLEEIGFQASIDAFYLFYTELHRGTPIVDAVGKVVTQFLALKFFAAPLKVLAELAWIKYKQNLTAEEIKRRKALIISEIVAIQGGISPEQIVQLDASLTPDSGERDQQRHSQIFNT